MTVKVASRPKKRCKACRNWFKPRRVNQDYCNARCRYQRFSTTTQRVRVRADEAAPPILHAIHCDGAPVAYCVDRATADNLTRYLRRQHRRHNPTGPRVRYSIHAATLAATGQNPVIKTTPKR